MNKKINVLLGIATSFMSLIAILVLFAPMFKNTYSSIDTFAGEEFGSAFQVMFYGYTNDGAGYSAVPLLILAFVVECVAFVGGLFASVLDEKKATIVFAVNAVLLIAAGILFLLGKNLWVAVNGEFKMERLNDYLEISTGPICSTVFAWLGGLISAYGVYSIKNK